MAGIISSTNNFLRKIFRFAAIKHHPNSKKIFLLCFNIIFAMAGLGIVAPILPQIQSWGGASTTLMGIFVSSFALAKVALDIPAGVFCDRYGGSVLTAAGMAIILAGSLVSAFASNFVFLFLGRIAAGVGSALAVSSIQTELLRLADINRRSTIMSYFMIARRAGVSIFPLIGGALATFFNWRAVFIFCAFLNLTGIIIALVSSRIYNSPAISFQEDLDLPAGSAAPHMEQNKTPEKIKPIVFYALYILAFTIYLSRNGLERTVLPLFGSNIGLDSFIIGLALSLASFISLGSIFLGGYFADKYGRKIVLQVGLAALIFAELLFLTVKSYPLYFVASMFLGAAAFITGLPVVVATDLSPGGELGRTLGRVRFFIDLGTMVGPVFLGWLMDLYGFHVCIMISVLTLALTTLLITFFLSESNPNKLQRISNGKAL